MPAEEEDMDLKVTNGILVTTEDRSDDPPRCTALRQCCDRATRPLHTKYNPLESNASTCQIVKHAFMCPPHGKLAKYCMFIIMFLVCGAVLFSLHLEIFLALLVLFFACVVGGYLVVYIKLPPLLGMLIVGSCLRNIPTVKVIGESLDSEWSAALRQIALTIILIRAGLGLDPAALKKLSFAVIRLAFSPCLAECVAEAIAAHFLLGFPWIWSFMLGFVLAAVSPAVVVPSLINLSDRGYGIDKGIPTLVIAAASVDDVLAITGFGVCLGIAFSEGDLALSIVKGPLEAVVGVLYGIVGGVILWYIPNRASRHVVLYRTFLLFGLGLVSTFGSSKVEFPGAGPLGCLTLAFIAGYRWKKEDWSEQGGKEPMEGIVAIVWMIFQPLLFGLIGSEVNLAEIDVGSVGLGIAVLAIGLVIRLIVSFFAVWGTDLNLKEKLFIPLAWFPKATVQAAIGAMAMDKASEVKDTDGVRLGKQILTLAVLSIIITAPVGAAVIALTGPRLLHRTEQGQCQEEERVEGQEEKGMLLEKKVSENDAVEV